MSITYNEGWQSAEIPFRRERHNWRFLELDRHLNAENAQVCWGTIQVVYPNVPVVG